MPGKIELYQSPANDVRMTAICGISATNVTIPNSEQHKICLKTPIFFDVDACEAFAIIE
jgi:hypothetical protein